MLSDYNKFEFKQKRELFSELITKIARMAKQFIALLQ